MIQYTGNNKEEIRQFVGTHLTHITGNGDFQLLTKDGVVYIEVGNWVGYVSGSWHVFSERMSE